LYSLIPHLLRRLRSDERGFILATSVIVLLVLLLTMTAFTLAASNNTTTSYHTGSSVQALAAAQAGEQAALFRVNNAPGTSGATGASGTLGNGATYSYTVTSLSSSSSPCTGLYISTSGINQDCIQSTGTANGVKQTVEERVAGYAATASLYPVNGLFASGGFSTNSPFSGSLSLGSNGYINFANPAINVGGALEYPSGTPPYCASGTCGATYSCGSSCVLTPSSAFTVPSVPASYWASAYRSNNNANITYNGSTTWPSGAQGSTPPNSSDNYTPSLYSTNAPQNSPTVLGFPPGTYYFCNFPLPQGYEIATTAAASSANPVIIYIDSYYDQSIDGHDPNCPAPASSEGTLGSGQAYNEISNTSNTASALQIYLYGEPGCSGSNCPGNLNFGELTGPMSTVGQTPIPTLYADIFAPNSSFGDSNQFAMTGAMTVGYFNGGNATAAFNWQASPGSVLPANSTFYPTASGICPNSYASAGC